MFGLGIGEIIVLIMGIGILAFLVFNYIYRDSGPQGPKARAARAMERHFEQIKNEQQSSSPQTQAKPVSHFSTTASKDKDGPNKKFHTKVAGVTHGSRQSYLKRIARKMYSDEGEETEIILVRDSKNKQDPNAIKVKTESGKILGFIKADVANGLARQMDGIYNATAYIDEITGYDDFEDEAYQKNLGCTIVVELSLKN